VSVSVWSGMVWIHGAEVRPQIQIQIQIQIQREFDVQGLSPVRELRAIGALPHSDSAMRESNVSRHGFDFVGGDRAAVQPGMASRVARRLSGRRQGVNWDKRQLPGCHAGVAG
jgi:hypothetical protein